MIVAAVLGGVTVLTELAWWVVLIHLGVAELLLACLIVVAIAGWDGTQARPAELELKPDRATRNLLTAAILGVFVLILSGSFMVGYGAGTSCATWPLCRGSLWPDGAAAYMIHMGHRYVAAIVGLVVLTAAWQVFRRVPDNASARNAAAGVVIAFVLQILVGAAVIWTAFGSDFKAIHLSAATLVWATLVAMAGLVFLPKQSRLAPTAALRYGHA